MNKLKKRQYRELIAILKMQEQIIADFCLNHIVTHDVPYVEQDIQRSINYINSAHNQLALLINEDCEHLC